MVYQRSLSINGFPAIYEVNVSSSSRVWIKQISPIASMDDTEITLEEIKRMKQEMLRLQEENEILLENLTL